MEKTRHFIVDTPVGQLAIYAKHDKTDCAADYQVKEEVRKARDRYIEMGAAAGFEMVPITWTQKRKGVDDLYKHLFRNK